MLITNKKWGLMILLLLGAMLPCRTESPHQTQQRSLEKATVVLQEGSLIDTFNAPILELARAIQVRPQSRIFHVSGYLMFGGYQNWDFWYDRQTHRLRYKYASGGETHGDQEEGVWSNVTDAALEHLAQDHGSDNYRGTRLLGFETLGKYGGKLERVWKKSNVGLRDLIPSSAR
jgi:hypothetical protein